MVRSRKSLVSKWKNNPIVEAVIFCIVLAVIAITAFIAHATRLDIVAQREALKAAQELSDRKWRQFFRSNKDMNVPSNFFNRETILEIESENASPPHNGNLYPQKK